MVVLTLSESLLSSEDVFESSDSRAWLEEDLSGQGSCSDVEPVLVIGRNFLKMTGLDILGAVHRSHLLLHLELLSIGPDKGLGRDILNSDSVFLFNS